MLCFTEIMTTFCQKWVKQLTITILLLHWLYIKYTGMSCLCYEIFWYGMLSVSGIDRCREKGAVFLFQIPPVMAVSWPAGSLSCLYLFSVLLAGRICGLVCIKGLLFSISLRR